MWFCDVVWWNVRKFARCAPFGELTFSKWSMQDVTISHMGKQSIQSARETNGF